jgi:hypothetical protein
MMNSFLSYCKGSFFRINIELNPFRWGLMFDFVTETGHDPGFIFQLVVEVGPINIDIMLDNLEW